MAMARERVRRWPAAVLLLLMSAAAVAGFDAPCAEQLIGGACRTDEECFGPTSVCADGRCACPVGLEAVGLSDGSTVCRPAPGNVAAPCSSACQPPLLCANGRCECDGGTVLRNGTCVVECAVGKRVVGVECRRTADMWRACERDADCRLPLSHCRKYAPHAATGRCECVEGTRFDRRSGVCVAVCPDGSPLGIVCRRLFVNDIDMQSHRSSMDSCPADRHCASYGMALGHCCPLHCPYGNALSEFTCDKDGEGQRSCDRLTSHYCHRVAKPGGTKAICCPTPCTEPRPVYYDNACHPLSHLDDGCDFDAQCEGGVTMRCVAGKCRCRGGFEPSVSGRFATCARRCLPHEVPTAGACLPPVPLGGRCADSRQCGRRARCYMGGCECDCDAARRQLFGKTVCAAPGGAGNLFDLFGRGLSLL